MSQQKFTTIVVVLILFVTGAFVYMKNFAVFSSRGGPFPSATIIASEVATQHSVVYENSTFMPGMLHIRLGDTAIFKK